MRTPSSVAATLIPPVAAVLLVVPAAARRPEPQAGAAPVLVDFRAVAEDGQPIADLKPADVTLRVGGRPRSIKSLEFVKIGSDAAPAAVTATLPPPYATNASVASGPGTRRDVLLVLDELSITPGKEVPIRESLNRLLGALSLSDRVGVLSTRQGGASAQFTEKLDDVREALGRFAGYAPARLSDADFACNAVLVLNTLRSSFREFSAASAPTLVFVTAAVAGPATDQMATVGRESELCPLRTNHFEEVGAAAQSSHASVYVVHALEAAPATQSSRTAQAGIDAIAGVTGAETLRITGGATDASLTRIARETSGYYLASFDAEPSDRSGNRQRLEVRVARDAVRVNVRPYLVVGRADTAAPAAAKPVAPNDMIRVPTVFTDLPLRAAWTARRNQDGKIRIDALFSALDPSAKLAAATAMLYDQKGRSRAQWKPEGPDLTRNPVLASLVVDPGVYRLRIAVTDAAGRAGTVDSDVRAELPQAGGVSISHLVLGVPAGGSFAPRLDYTPQDEQAIGLVEIYGVPKGAKVEVVFELAESENGPAVATGPAQIGAGPAEDTRMAFGGFGITPMKPGDLLLRAVVTVDGKPVGTVSRTLRKNK
jgi:hypothetical protein